MSEPRAQRHVAPTHLPRSGASSVAARPTGLDDAFIVFAHAVLKREAAAFAANKPQVASSPAPEEIHQLRVAARRLRVALRLFGPMLPSRDATRLKTELRWFAGALGDARDLDVYAESLRAYAQALSPAQRAGLSGYQLYLRRERAQARASAAAAVASPRAAELNAELERFAATGPSAGALRRWGSLTVRDALRQNVRRSVARVRRQGNQLVVRARPAELHALRIKAKRLRYELEFFADAYPKLKQPAKECKALQDLLGIHQDVSAANARLRQYAALRRKEGEDRAVPPALLELRRQQLAVAREARRSFREKWPAFAAALGAVRKLIA